MPLLELMQKHGTDKADHRYDIPYSLFFEHRREQVKKVLEIGVKKGASLRLWEDYFPQAQVFGIDIDPKCLMVAGKSTVLIGSQKDPIFLQEVATRIGGDFDLIVDDGAHVADAQVISLAKLWPCLRTDGGVYAIEDLHAHLKTGAPNKKFNNRSCPYPPFGELMQRRIGTYFSRARCKHESPGLCCFPGIVFLFKTGNVLAPSFETMRKGKWKA